MPQVEVRVAANLPHQPNVIGKLMDDDWGNHVGAVKRWNAGAPEQQLSHACWRGLRIVGGAGHARPCREPAESLTY